MEINYRTNNIKTFRRIRKAIGILGIALPILLIVLTLIPFFDTAIQPSISDYYYTNFRELFTGVLWAVGLFLFLYKGHPNKNFWKNDSRLTNIAGFMAFGIALFPTSPADCSEKMYSFIPVCAGWLGTLHYVFAGVFFIVLSIISINVFTIGQNKDTAIPMSMLNENYIYKTCGYLMLLFIVLTPICAKFNCFNNSTLVFEAIMLFLFGTSWLIKGRALGDKGEMGKMVYRENN